MNIRPFDVDGETGPGSHQILIGGGIPGKSGEVAYESFGLGDKLTPSKKKKIARDVVYSVALGHEYHGVGCADGRVLLLRPNLEILREVHRHTAPCRDVRFSPDGRLLASGGRDGLVIVTPVDAGESMVLQDHTAGVECLAFSPEGLLASGALDGKVRIHEGKLLRRTYQKLGAEVLSLAYGGRRSRQLFAGLADGRIVELDPNSAQHTVIAQLDSAVYSMIVLWQWWLVLGLNGEVRVLDLRKSKSPEARQRDKQGRRQRAARQSTHRPAATELRQARVRAGPRRGSLSLAYPCPDKRLRRSSDSLLSIRARSLFGGHSMDRTTRSVEGGGVCWRSS